MSDEGFIPSAEESAEGTTAGESYVGICVAFAIFKV